MDALALPPGGRRSASAARASAITLPAAARTRAPALSAGDAVVHATFGEGVVTAIEGGGDLVKVRFAQDGAERRLMAGAAPMRKVG